MLLNQNSVTLDTTAFNVRLREQDTISNKITKMLPAVKDKVLTSILEVSKKLTTENIQRLEVDRKQNKIHDERFKLLTKETEALNKQNENKFNTLYTALLTGKLNNKDLHFVELLKDLRRDLRNGLGNDGGLLEDLLPDGSSRRTRRGSRNKPKISTKPKPTTPKVQQPKIQQPKPVSTPPKPTTPKVQQSKPAAPKIQQPKPVSTPPKVQQPKIQPSAQPKPTVVQPKPVSIPKAEVAPKPTTAPSVQPKPTVAPKPGILAKTTGALATGAKNTGGKILGGLSTVAKGTQGVARGAGALATPLLVLNSATNMYQAYQEGDYETVAGEAGGLAGGLVGAKVGGAAGAAIGSVVPVVGTAIGGFVGGIVGGAAGYFGGEELLSSAYNWWNDEEEEEPKKEDKEDDGWFSWWDDEDEKEEPKKEKEDEDDGWFSWWDDDEDEKLIETPDPGIPAAIGLEEVIGPPIIEIPDPPILPKEEPSSQIASNLAKTQDLLVTKSDENNSILATTSTILEAQLLSATESLDKIQENLKILGEDFKDTKAASLMGSIGSIFGSVKSFIYGGDSTSTSNSYSGGSYSSNSYSGGGGSYNSSGGGGSSSGGSGGVALTRDPNAAEPDSKAAGEISKYAQIGGVDFAGLQPDMKARFASAAKEYFEATGRKIKVTSAHRSDAKQAELWVRKNKLGDRSIYSVSRPKNTTTIKYPVRGVMQTFTVQGSGRGSNHRPGLAVDVSAATGDAAAFKPFAMKYGIVQPYPVKDPVHYELPKGTPQLDSTAMEDGDGIKPTTLSPPKEAEMPAAVPISPPSISTESALAVEDNTPTATTIIPQEDSEAISKSASNGGSSGASPKPIINSSETKGTAAKSSSNKSSTKTSSSSNQTTKVKVTTPSTGADLPTWVNDNSVQAFRIDPLTPIEG